VSVGPGIYVIPINRLAADGNNILNVVSIFAPTCPVGPTQFGNHYVFYCRQPNFTAQILDPPTAAKATLIVIVIAQMEKFDLEGRPDDVNHISHRAGGRLE
jgi:hypothetical protein